MTTSENSYRRYLGKVHALRSRHAERPLKVLKGLGAYANQYAYLSSAMELGSIPKTHVIGLLGSFGNLRRSDSALGLFSDAFEEVAKKIAESVVALTVKDPPLIAPQLVQWWLELSVLMAVGVMELARQGAVPTKRETYYDSTFRDELLQIALFSSGYPHYFFMQMANALGVTEERNASLFCSIFESVAIIAVLNACAKEFSEVRPDWIDNLSKRLESHLSAILEALQEATDESFEQRTLLEQLKIAVQRSDYEGLIEISNSLLESAGYSSIQFQNDLNAIKSLFIRFKEAFIGARENKAVMTHLVG